MTAFFGYFGAVGRAWEFAAGALLALVAGRLAGMQRWSAEVLAWVGVALIAGSLVLLREDMPYPGWWALLPVCGTLALIASGVAGADQRSPGCCRVRPMTWAGDISYSWYLWHWPMVVFALVLWPSRPFLAPAGAVALSVVPAVLSYRFVEQPIRLASRMPRRRLGLLAAACFGIPLALAGLLALGARSTWWMQWPTSYAYQDSASYVRGCHDTEPGLDGCRWEAPGVDRDGPPARRLAGAVAVRRPDRGEREGGPVDRGQLVLAVPVRRAGTHRVLVRQPGLRRVAVADPRGAALTPSGRVSAG